MKHLPAILGLSLLAAGCSHQEDATAAAKPAQAQGVADSKQVPPVGDKQPAAGKANSPSADEKAAGGQSGTPSRDKQAAPGKARTPSQVETPAADQAKTPAAADGQPTAEQVKTRRPAGQATAGKASTPSPDKQAGKKPPPADGWRPPGASSAYWRPPIDVTFPALPEVPEGILGPSPRIEQP